MGSGIAHAADHAINPDEHDAYWQENHAAQPTPRAGGTYEQYRTAYRTGYTGAQEHGATKTFADAESTLKGTYEQAKDSASLGWDKAKHATKAAYDKAADEIQIVLHEEQLRVGKREVSGGERAASARRSTPSRSTSPSNCATTDVTIERVAAGDVRDVNAADAFKEGTIEVNLTREEAVVSKEAHVTGAVRLHKTSETETQNVSETVRKEDVEVIRDGKTEVKRDERTGR